ncbi:MAG: tRNA (guanosine(46)-N7)-methyltransferase TrmB [Gammaproteobacteria bacterium]|nr:tRNA (guanosine(46)-N7)-methyltransferase TrmB [Gammaproteobacteria bacterium]
MADRPPDHSPGRRPIRSYVLREGRLTAGQRRALEQLWPRYGLTLPPAGEAPDYRRAFGRNAPLHLEIGFGDGGALLEMAGNNPHCNFLGAEVHRPGVGRLLLQIEARQLANIRLFCEDGMGVLTTAVAERALAAVYLYFPDPWPKKRHHKRRIMQPAFIELAATRLAAGGHFHFATDWQDYAEQALERLEQCGQLENCAGRGCFSPRPAWRPQTKFERRGQRLGHRVRDIVMRKAR